MYREVIRSASCNMWAVLTATIILLVCCAESRVLPNSFFLDIDGISIAPSSGHMCALEAKPGSEIGGPPVCWGLDTDSLLKPPVVG